MTDPNLTVTVEGIAVTVILQVAVLLFVVLTVMVAVPAAFAVTSPVLLLTVATFELEVEKVYLVGLPLSMVAFS